MDTPAIKGRILIVEDEGLVAEDLHVSLDSLGYSVVGVADTADSAMAIAREHAPDLALLDICIKGPVDGISLASRLRAESVGFVFLTAHADAATIERAQGTEPLGYVLKPFDTRTLNPVLQTAMRRNNSEQRLRRTERWLSTTLRSIGDGVIVADVAQRVKFLNPAAEALTGWTNEEAEGKPVSDVMRLVRGKQRERVACPAARAIEARTTIQLEPDTGLLRRNGTWIAIDDSAAPVRDDDGTILGAVVVCRDATDSRMLVERQREVERQMHQAEKLQGIGVLAGGLAHDLNNVLTAILGNVELCRVGALYADQQPLDEIERNARAAAELCRQILAGAGSGPMQRQAVDVGDLIEECIARERALAPPAVELHLRGARPAPHAFCDRSQIGQVLSNLLRNSVEALGDDTGTVVVSHDCVSVADGDILIDELGLQPGEYVAIHVIDDGPGMGHEIQARVFDPFFTTKFTGRGLGLSSVRRIVQRHGGAITLDSEPGRGTAIRVFVPCPARGSAEVGAANSQTRLASGGERILVVDDDASVLRVARLLLEGLGYQVCEASSADQAIEVLTTQENIAGLVMDVVMPGRSGIEALADIRRLTGNLPVLLISGFPGSNLPLTDRYVGFLVKPFSADDLGQALRRLLDATRAS